MNAVHLKILIEKAFKLIQLENQQLVSGQLKKTRDLDEL